MNFEAVTQQIREACAIKGLDASALVHLLSQALADLDEANAAIERHGAVIDDKRGSLKTNPACRLKTTALSTIHQILKSCGLTPSNALHQFRQAPTVSNL